MICMTRALQSSLEWSLVDVEKALWIFGSERSLLPLLFFLALLSLVEAGM